MNSARIQEIVLNLLSDNRSYSVQEIKRHLNNIDSSDYSEGQFAGSINTLLRNGSIKKIDRGVYSINLRRENMRKCFVVSPIGDEGTEIRKRADQLYTYIIKPVCEKCEFEAIRGDLINASDSIDQTILDHLKNDDLIIADISGHNPNVFYEIGYRTSLGKNIIHLKEKGEIIPFDVVNIRTFDYDLKDLDSVSKIKTRLIQTIENLSFDEKKTSDESGAEIEKSNNILPILYEISDKIDDLKTEVKSVNSDTIQSIVMASTSAASAAKTESTEDFMTKMIMEQLLKNPSSADSLLALADKFNNLK